VPSVEHIQDALLRIVLPPALLALTIMALACLLARWCGEIVTLIGSIAALAAALVLGAMQGRRLAWVPESFGWHWLLWTTISALIVDALARIPRIPPGLDWALRGMVAAQAGWLLCPSLLRNEHAWAPLALGVLILTEWAVLEQLLIRDRRGLVALALVPGANVAAVVLIYAASARFSELALVLMAGIAGVGVVALVLAREIDGVGAATAIQLPGLLLAGQQDTFTEVAFASFALAAISPLTLAPLLLGAWRCRQKKGLIVVQVLLLLLPLAGSLYLAAQTGQLDFD
jgi:hypothetical protein